ncbi:MAG: hypothetical protein GX653_08505 [Clostridiales bacterium]|nr:hypothetical protein [Clostridiales bacterium]
MGKGMDENRIAAALALRGISRAQAARALHLSCSALNKKLRGQVPLQPEERLALRRLVTAGEEQRP